MAKKPKQKQTEWNVQGKEIADTAVPYYQQNLGNINEYVANPQQRMDDYISKYYTNTPEQNAFMRNYTRAMGSNTAQNYAATGGGYDTSNQRLYDDQQRYYNDLAANLYNRGITSGYGMANQDYNNMLNAQNVYQAAYNMGRNYSDVDQYNYQVGQTNKWYNQLGGLLGTAGAAIGGAVGGPVGSTIGASLGNTLGSAVTTDFGASASSSFPYANMGTNALLGYYNQQANIPNTQSVRESGGGSTEGQFTNTGLQTNVNPLAGVSADFLSRLGMRKIGY